MKQQLPSQPSLEQLKKQAKDLFKLFKSGNPESLPRIKESHPRFTGDSPGAEFSLGDAQFVIAREYGFESWPKLKIHVEALARGGDPVVAAFVEAVCGGHQKQAEKLVAEHPSLARATPYTAAILGEAEVIERMIPQDEGLATRPVGPKKWPPLLYAAFSKFHRENQKIAEGIVSIAKMLLAHGADANTMYTWQDENNWKLSALWGATCVANNPGLARVLLEAGANPNDGESVYHSAENYHFECLGVLAEFGANISGPIQPWNNTPLYFILGHRPTKGNAKQVFEGVRWLLEHGADPNASSYDIEGRPIHLAASGGWGTDMFDLLLRHGADLTARRKDVTSVPPTTSHTLRPDPVALVGGKSAYALAARYGQTHAMDWLREHGAQTALTPTEEFFAACGRGDEPAVRAILAVRPELIQSMSEPDKLVLAFAAGDGKTEAVRLMLVAGMSMDIRGDTGGTPLHQAAWYGQLEVVKLLLTHHAPLEEKDTTYGGTPLGWVCHGSINCRNPKGDYRGIAEVLIEAGAEIMTGHNGTEEVNAVIRRYSAARKPKGTQTMAITIQNITAMFQVYDMHRSIAFYRDVLGFELVDRYAPGGRFYWAMLRHGDARLMLNAKYEDEHRPAKPSPVAGHKDVTLYLGCPNVDDVYADLQAKGHPVNKPETTYYGMRQLHVIDPDEFELCFQHRAK